MAFLNKDKCDNCHTIILGKPRSLFHFSHHGFIDDNIAEVCKVEEKERTVDEGALIRHQEVERTVARCFRCGRIEKSDWRVKEEEKEWKDDKCE